MVVVENWVAPVTYRHHNFANKYKDRSQWAKPIPFVGERNSLVPRWAGKCGGVPDHNEVVERRMLQAQAQASSVTVKTDNDD